MVTLRPMDANEFARWLPRMRDSYARDIAVHGGASENEAQGKATADIEQLFPAGQPSADQFIFVLEAGGEDVGELWVAEHESWRGPVLWIYDIHVEDTHRGRGYGREAMLLAEAEGRRRGLGRITLMRLRGQRGRAWPLPVARLWRERGHHEQEPLRLLLRHQIRDHRRPAFVARGRGSGAQPPNRTPRPTPGSSEIDARERGNVRVRAAKAATVTSARFPDELRSTAAWLRFPETDVLAGSVRPEAVHGGGARRAEDHDAQRVDPVRVVPVVGSPALAGLRGVAPAEVAFEHRHAR